MRSGRGGGFLILIAYSWMLIWYTWNICIRRKCIKSVIRLHWAVKRGIWARSCQNRLFTLIYGKEMLEWTYGQSLNILLLRARKMTSPFPGDSEVQIYWNVIAFLFNFLFRKEENKQSFVKKYLKIKGKWRTSKLIWFDRGWRPSCAVSFLSSF